MEPISEDNEEDWDQPWSDEEPGDEWGLQSENGMWGEAPKEPYKTVDSFVIQTKMKEMAAELGDFLGMDPPYGEATLLLQANNWSMDAAKSTFLNDFQSFRIKAGLDVNPNKINCAMETDEVECSICLDDFPAAQVGSLECGHIACFDCWEHYIKNSAKNFGCFRTTCVQDQCEFVATPERLRKMGLQESNCQILERQAQKFRMKKFVEIRDDFHQCLSPNCNKYQHLHQCKQKLNDILCSCGYTYCILCKNIGHRPCRCDVVRAWIEKESAESENLKWIKANTKKCPKCRTPIQKNQGCNHMTCQTAGGCGYEFCWLCKGDWKEHGSSTGGFYKCNIYETNQKKGIVSEEDSAQQDAKTSLERYTFYFERYDNHIKAIAHMKKTLEKADARMADLMTRFGWKPNEVGFIKEASQTIILCRKLLAWSYPIGFYLDQKCPQFALFTEVHQRDLERYTENLQELAEQDLEVFQDNKKREDVINYQRTLKTFQTNLQRFIEENINIQCNFNLGDEEN